MKIKLEARSFIFLTYNLTEEKPLSNMVEKTTALKPFYFEVLQINAFARNSTKRPRGHLHPVFLHGNILCT